MQSNLVNPCVAGPWNLELPEGWQLTENRALSGEAEPPGTPPAEGGAPGQTLPCERIPEPGNPNAKVPQTAVPEAAAVKTETESPTGEAQRNALEKKALQGLARCVRGYTMQEVKRTYEPDPEGGRRLKSEVVTRRTIAPDLDAILFALTNLNPDRWQAKPAPGSAVKSAAGTTSPERNGANAPRTPDRSSPPDDDASGDDMPVDLSALSDAALAELSALPEWRAAMPAAAILPQTAGTNAGTNTGAETAPQSQPGSESRTDSQPVPPPCSRTVSGLNSSPDPHNERNLSRKHPTAARLRRDLPGYSPGPNSGPEHQSGRRPEPRTRRDRFTVRRYELAFRSGSPVPADHHAPGGPARTGAAQPAGLRAPVRSRLLPDAVPHRLLPYLGRLCQRARQAADRLGAAAARQVARLFGVVARLCAGHPPRSAYRARVVQPAARVAL